VGQGTQQLPSQQPTPSYILTCSRPSLRVARPLLRLLKRIYGYFITCISYSTEADCNKNRGASQCSWNAKNVACDYVGDAGL
jgi:hypothetical protein